MKKNTSGIIIGVVCVVMAVLLILAGFGVIPFYDVDIWELFWTVILVVILITSIPNLNWFGILMPIAFLLMIYDEYLGIYNVSGWVWIAAAALGSIGLSAIFGAEPLRNKRNSTLYGSQIPNQDARRPDENIVNEDGSVDGAGGEYVNHAVTFGSSVKYIECANYYCGDFRCEFGALKLYFTKTQLCGDIASANVNVSFGDIKIFVPQNWVVENHVVSAFGDVSEKTPHQPTGDKKLVLTGNVSFGSVEIYYV